MKSKLPVLVLIGSPAVALAVAAGADVAFAGIAGAWLRAQSSFRLGSGDRRRSPNGQAGSANS